MVGMNMENGAPMTDIEYLRQSVWRILATKPGTRLMRPTFGSRLPELVDYPFNEATKLAMIAATGDAVARWEPTLEVDRIEVIQRDDPLRGEKVVVINLYGKFFGTQVALENLSLEEPPVTADTGSLITDGQGNVITQQEEAVRS